VNLLILDDEDIICTFLADVARGLGWTVETANGKVDFRSQLFRRLPDAVILDLHLGETDGISEMRFLAQCRFGGPIGLMSGFDHRVLSSAQKIGESLGLHVVAVLAKPIRAAAARELLAAFELRLARKPPGDAVPLAATVMPAGPLTPAALETALQCEEMELYYQPIIDAATSQVSHVEALIRWNHPQFGLILPGTFIAIAETNQRTIDRLTDWVLSTAAGHVRSLHQLRLPIPVAVNISGANLQSVDYPEHVEALLGAGVVPASLIFEVTESVAARNPSAADILTRLRLKGFALSIDDFGTGYSSLEALRRIPFSSIKVDQTFVADLAWSKDSLAIVTSVIALARSMDLTSIAEGVETSEVAKQLVELGIDQLQGYYYSRPIPFSQLVPWLQKRSLQPAAAR
jgi:EAL domain-containing protein (putative c-di-GMP-specific phosphodiesterase class I)/ActR/RegA family two-component response regulator